MAALVATVTFTVGALGPPTVAAAGDFCEATLGGGWVEHGKETCVSRMTSERNAITEMSVSLPDDLIRNPLAGPVFSTFLRSRADAVREAAKKAVRASTTNITYQAYRHGALRSVFHESAVTVGATPNNGYRTFTMDLGRGTGLRLADLFDPGVDPLTALPELIRPYLDDALDRAQPPHQAGTYPFTTDRFEPAADGSGYSGDYRAFAVTPDELILYLPDMPMSHENPTPRDLLVWSMDGGTVEVHVPLSALTSILREL